ncbi:MAG: hypothetical protein LBD02_02165 [Christensenellaceae bacterium]|jgi:hypothetical protein|nr:hypothetical protein [Christensenellaceae bacterium]
MKSAKRMVGFLLLAALLAGCAAPEAQGEAWQPLPGGPRPQTADSYYILHPEWNRAELIDEKGERVPGAARELSAVRRVGDGSGGVAGYELTTWSETMAFGIDPSMDAVAWCGTSSLEANERNREQKEPKTAFLTLDGELLFDYEWGASYSLPAPGFLLREERGEEGQRDDRTLIDLENGRKCELGGILGDGDFRIEKAPGGWVALLGELYIGEGELVFLNEELRVLERRPCRNPNAGALLVEGRAVRTLVYLAPGERPGEQRAVIAGLDGGVIWSFTGKAGLHFGYRDLPDGRRELALFGQNEELLGFVNPESGELSAEEAAGRFNPSPGPNAALVPFEGAQRLSETERDRGVFRSSTGGKWEQLLQGLVDEKGGEILPPIYEMIARERGLLSVRTRREYGLMDESGNWILCEPRP